MPLYVYRCPRCGKVEELQRKIADMDAPVYCTGACDNGTRSTPQYLDRVPTAPSGSFPGADSWRGGR